MIRGIIIGLSNFLVSISNHVYGNTVASAASRYHRGNFELAVTLAVIFLGLPEYEHRAALGKGEEGL